MSRAVTLRPERESNPRIVVLQTTALPLRHLVNGCILSCLYYAYQLPEAPPPPELPPPNPPKLELDPEEGKNPPPEFHQFVDSPLTRRL